MTLGFDYLDDAFHQHIVNKIEHHETHGSEGHVSEKSDPWFAIDWCGIATKVAGQMAMEYVSEHLPSALLGENHSQLESGHEPNPLHTLGAPNSDGFHHQTTGFTCAIVSQKMILDQFGVVDPQTGKPVSEALLVYEATSNGWLSDHGMSIDDMGKNLEAHGIPVHHGHSWDELLSDLKNGHQVAIAVNADELWHGNSLSTFFNQLLPGQPNHAVVLKGLIVDSQGHVSVVINDPGQIDGGGVEYSLTKFQAALGAGGFHFVATDIAPENWRSDDRIGQYLDQLTACPGGAASNGCVNSYSDSLAAMSTETRFDFLRSI